MARNGEEKERKHARKLERGVKVSRHSSPTKSSGGYFFQGTECVSIFSGGHLLLWLLSIKTELALKCVVRKKKPEKAYISQFLNNTNC